MDRIFIVFIGSFFVLLFTNFFFLYLSSYLLEQPLEINRKIKNLLYNTLLFSLLISTVSTTNLLYPKSQLTTVSYTLNLGIQLLSGFFLIKYSYKNISFYCYLFMQSLMMVLMTFTEYLLLIVLSNQIELLPDKIILFSAVPLTFIQVIICLGICWSVRKTKLASAIKNIIIYQKSIAIFSNIFFFSELLSYHFNSWLGQGHEQTWIFLCFVYLGIIISFSLITFAISKNTQWKYTEELLIQQRTYMKQMESVQQELRVIQHDYKNILAGLYLHANNGDIDEVQNYLSDRFFQIDYKLEKKFTQQNQLQLIEVLEIKSLLINKIITAEENNIHVHIEVTSKISSINMKSSDLIRILGIFLDNAIESILEEKVSPPKINITLSKDNEILTIIISNYFSKSLPISKILESGFSTKGALRGMGLGIVKNILSNYSNVLNETSIKNKQFSQILTIRGDDYGSNIYM